MDDGVIDLGEYVRRKEEEAEPERSVFAIWGAEGERSRFALPLWRAAYLASGTRASLAWEVPGDAPELLTAFVVLDLGVDPARTTVSGERVEELRGASAPPAISLSGEGLSIYLGEREGRRWYLVVDHVKEPVDPDALELNDLYFLAGECAGLLFHREMDADAGRRP